MELNKNCFTEWETSKTNSYRYCNNREKRVNHYTAQMDLLFTYMTDWIPGTTLQVTTTWVSVSTTEATSTMRLAISVWRAISSPQQDTTSSLFSCDRNIKKLEAVLRIRIQDPLPFWLLDPGWIKNNFWVKIFEFFDADPGWKKFGSCIQDKHPRSAKLIKGKPILCLLFSACFSLYTESNAEKNIWWSF